MKDKKILVTGVSGTGKTAVYRALKERGIAVIGIDETPGLCSWADKKGNTVQKKDMDFSKAFLRDHEWICDIHLLKELLHNAEGPVVVCGSCDNIGECMKHCDTTLLLECSPEIFTARIDARDDNPYGKQESAKQVLLGYYKQYNQECREAGAIPIDASQSLDGVVQEVISHIQ